MNIDEQIVFGVLPVCSVQVATAIIITAVVIVLMTAVALLSGPATQAPCIYLLTNNGSPH